MYMPWLGIGLGLVANPKPYPDPNPDPNLGSQRAHGGQRAVVVCARHLFRVRVRVRVIWEIQGRYRGDVGGT